MQSKMLFCFVFLVILSISSAGDISLYQYFTEDGINEGLTAQGPEFKLNGKELKILSGSLHYFRVHPQYWSRRLRQYKAAGLNTIDIYVPWNLHEPQRGEFDFGDGNSQFSPFLNITRFIEMVQEEDMFAIFRPGPYICGEWEFGGLPSWLLHDHPMYFRSSYQPYQERAEIYMKELIAKVQHLQFDNGGPIIMTQIENEFGNYGYGDHPRDKQHLKFLKSVLRGNGITTLLFTSDTPTLTADWGNIDYELMTANFKWGSEAELERLKELRPNAPIIVTEYWPGWFDHWFEPHHNILSEENFRLILGNIFGVNGSVNFYMFHGGTNFAFMNGANILGYNGIELMPSYVPDVTSYDYDAPLSESGQYKPKYYATKEMIEQYDPLYDLLSHPDVPPVPNTTVYSDVTLSEFIPYWNIIENVPEQFRESHSKPTPMEQLNINNGNGQSFGYIVYRKSLVLKPGMTLTIRGHPRDLVQVMVNGVQVNDPIYNLADLGRNFGSWGIRDAEFVFSSNLEGCESGCTLDIMVENLGRANFGAPHNFEQKKGLWEGDVLLDDAPLDDWEHISIEMKPDWLASLASWEPYIAAEQTQVGPRLFRGYLTIEEDVPESGTYHDTFFDYDCEACQDWKHGAVFVNGFNVGRYHTVGPQKSLYIPGPLLNQGNNEIIVFENYLGSDVFKFIETPNYGPPSEESAFELNELHNEL